MMITVENRCPFCGKKVEVEVEHSQYVEWLNGAMVQEAFPTLSATQREMLLTGMCPKCQDSIFGSGDEEDDDWEDADDFDSSCMNEEMGFDPFLGCYTDDC